MLRPQDNEARETKRLDGMWAFTPDPDGVGRREEWWRAALPGARPMPVPAAYNDVLVEEPVHDLVGDVWYQRDVVVPRGWDGRRVVLRFDAATHRATVWVDDEQVAEHEGGYTPFEADISHLAEPGTTLRVTVVVNNELTWESIPPGVINEGPDGIRRAVLLPGLLQLRRPDPQRLAVHHLGGARRRHHRDHRPRRHASGSCAGRRWSLTPAARTSGSRSATRRARWSPRERAPRASCGWPTPRSGGPARPISTTSRRPRRRRPSRRPLPAPRRHPHRAGRRRPLPDQRRALLLPGVRHARGPRHPRPRPRRRRDGPRLRAHDLARRQLVPHLALPLRRGVASTMADRLGIVVIDETAAVGLNLGVAGGFFGDRPRVTFSDETVDRATQALHQQAIEELIARDKNHPSVVLWSIANEPESHTAESKDYFEPLFDAAREADPTRPVGFVNMLLSPPDACLITELADVVMVNRYYGWYLGAATSVRPSRCSRAELERWADKHGKPILVTEYGADAMPGLHALRPVTRGARSTRPTCSTPTTGSSTGSTRSWASTCGTSPTSRPGQSFIRVDGNKKGVFTRDRRPKAAAHHLRRRWRPEARDVCPCPALDGDAGERCRRRGADLRPDAAAARSSTSGSAPSPAPTSACTPTICSAPAGRRRSAASRCAAATAAGAAGSAGRPLHRARARAGAEVRRCGWWARSRRWPPAQEPPSTPSPRPTRRW